ncbi:MAG: CCA tRNA nucleotidyltransferase [Verrucomicrobiales bacterium]|nr:CCA tRNA nucleotidyltransferase [Verrucomicrobiales bacterium]
MEQSAIQIVRRLQEAGFEALFAGGCVRDQLNGQSPQDYDIATSATPDQILTIFGKGEQIGAHFGVILVREKGHHFEIATFREDGDYSDGRRPNSVLFTTAERDALRRDFTVNGMFYDPVGETLIDFVSGQSDLRSKLIRAIGDPFDRFSEDHLRLLRAIRFATVLDFEIEEATWRAIKSLAATVATLPSERVREELDKIWKHPNRLKGFDLLAGSGLMEVLLPEVLELRGCEQPAQWHPEGDVYVHTRLMLSLLPPDASLPLVLSTLFHDIAKPDTFFFDEEAGRIRFNGHDKLGAEKTSQILKRLKYSNHVIDAVVEAVLVHMKFKDVTKMRKAKLKRFMARENFNDELELHRVDCLGSNGNLENYQFLIDKAVEFSSEPLMPPPFLSGKDLIARGLNPGPEFKTLLSEAQDLQLEGNLQTREDSLDWLDARITR